MRKIVFVVEKLFGGGAERVTVALANEFCKDSGNQVHLIIYSRDEDKDFFTDDSIILHEIGNITGGTKVQRTYKRIKRIRDIIKEIDPYCVVSLGSPIIVNPLVTALFGLKYPLILSERNDPRSFPVSKFQRFTRFICYTFCDGLVFQTHEAKRFFPKFIQKKGLVICNPITSKLPDLYQGERSPRIVNFCRLTFQKNLDLLIDAFADVSKEFKELSLDIYGDGEEKERLDNKIQSMGLSDKVILHGYTTNIYEKINDASLFVSSSDYEGISNSMLEAIALGIPSICTDCPAGGARETINDGVNGLLVPVKNKEAMVNAIKMILNDKALSNSISNEGVKLRETLSITEIAKKWNAAINNFVE